MRRRAVTALLSLTSLSLACSGLHVQETMANVQNSARIGAAAGGLLILFAALLRLRVAFPVCLVLLAIHPAWTMDPYHGDCGGAQETVTLLVALLSLTVFSWDLLRLSRRTHR